MDYFDRIALVSASDIGNIPHQISNERLLDEMGAYDGKDRVYYGADAFRQVFMEVPFLLPLGLFMKIPGIGYMSRLIYRRVASNRQKLGCNSSFCEIS